MPADLGVAYSPTSSFLVAELTGFLTGECFLGLDPVVFTGLVWLSVSKTGLRLSSSDDIPELPRRDVFDETEFEYPNELRSPSNGELVTECSFSGLFCRDRSPDPFEEVEDE